MPPTQDPTTGVTAAAVAAALVVAASAALTFAGALGFFFSQDDFVGLARAQGLVERLDGPWRYLSRQVFFDVMYAMAGLDARPYHLASLMGHIATAVLLFVAFDRRLGRAAALVGAVFFAVHPSHFTALYWIAAHGEIYALLFALAAFMLATETRSKWAWLAVPCFAVSLLFKESTVLLPLAIAVARGWAGPGHATPRSTPGSDIASLVRRIADPVLIALALVSVLYVFSFATANAFDVRGQLASDAPYAVGFGADLWRNLLSYLGWTANFFYPTVRTFSDAVEPAMYPIGVVVALAWLGGLTVPSLRQRGWLAAGVLFMLLLIPVLPLRNHTYHYYLYAPLFGAAWGVAAALDLAFGRFGARTAPAAIAIVLTLLLTSNGAQLVRKVERAPFNRPELRSDPTVDRALIADNARRGLAAASLPQDVHLYFWSPTARERQRTAGQDTTQASYVELNVESALQGGLAVRVLFPAVRAVSFVRTFRAIDNSDRYAVYRLDGNLRVGTYDDIRQALEAIQSP